PEADAFTQREERVSTEAEFFEDSHQHKRKRPLHCVSGERQPIQSKSTERVAMQGVDGNDLDTFQRQAPENSLPKQASKGSAKRESVVSELSAFNPSHYDSSRKQPSNGGEQK